MPDRRWLPVPGAIQATSRLAAGTVRSPASAALQHIQQWPWPVPTSAIPGHSSRDVLCASPHSSSRLFWQPCSTLNKTTAKLDFRSWRGSDWVSTTEVCHDDKPTADALPNEQSSSHGELPNDWCASAAESVPVVVAVSKNNTVATGVPCEVSSVAATTSLFTTNTCTYATASKGPFTSRSL